MQRPCSWTQLLRPGSLCGRTQDGEGIALNKCAVRGVVHSHLLLISLRLLLRNCDCRVVLMDQVRDTEYQLACGPSTSGTSAIFCAAC